MNATDRFAQWDAAYVLGSLSAQERREFEEHLAVCPTCRTAVADLAGMPGLLAQVPADEALAHLAGDDLEAWGPEAPLPTALMPRMELALVETPEAPEASESSVPARDPAARGEAGLFQDSRSPADPVVAVGVDGARRRWLAPAAAAAAALLIGGVGGYALRFDRAESTALPPVSSTATTRLAFSPVMAAPITAVVDVLPRATGTEFRVECQYAPSGVGVGGTLSPEPTPTGSPSSTGGPGAPGSGSAGPEYAIYIVGRDGTAMLAKTWTARPDRVMHPSAISALPVSQISAVEIRRVEGNTTLLRASLQ